jgi:hypothetical protein
MIIPILPVQSWLVEVQEASYSPKYFFRYSLISDTHFTSKDPLP